MTKRIVLAVLVGMISSFAGAASLRSNAPDLSGAWAFSVDLASGGHGDPTFVFKQEGDKITGAYTGPLGEHKVTGTVTGSKAVFGFEFTREGETIKVTYTGTIDAPDKMTGTVEFSVGETGKWTASRKAP